MVESRGNWRYRGTQNDDSLREVGQRNWFTSVSQRKGQKSGEISPGNTFEVLSFRSGLCLFLRSNIESGNLLAVQERGRTRDLRVFCLKRSISGGMSSILHLFRVLSVYRVDTVISQGLSCPGGCVPLSVTWWWKSLYKFSSRTSGLQSGLSVKRLVPLDSESDAVQRKTSHKVDDPFEVWGHLSPTFVFDDKLQRRWTSRGSYPLEPVGGKGRPL